MFRHVFVLDLGESHDIIFNTFDLSFRHFRDALIRRFSLEEECSTRKFKWIIILIWPQIYPEVIEFLRSFASETVRRERERYISRFDLINAFV